MENIVAISTSLAPSGVGIIRISGDNPLSIVEKMFVPFGKTDLANLSPNYMYLGEILGDGFTDNGFCVYFKGPKSYTGEDMVEFHCHGGTAICKGILQKALTLGARLATNGEFTKRAFLNGKMSLSSAEGLIDMINAESVQEVKAGYYLYRENLKTKIEDLQNRLTDVLAEIDADIDFPEEGIETALPINLKTAIEKINGEIVELTESYKFGRKIKDGVNVCICGKPNTGKSMLLNGLLNYDKAIVSEVAGTTRDVVEGTVDINGVRFNFSDTAGIRESADKIESMGIDRAKKVIDESDVVLFVFDGSIELSSEDKELYELIKDKNKIVVRNKTDKGSIVEFNQDITVSAKTKQNLDRLKSLLYDKTVGNGIDINGDFLTEERHFEALKSAKEKLDNAIRNIMILPPDIVAIDLKDAWEHLGEISGKTASEEIIGRIFSKFCVGK